jgi:ERCC4-type nuclease
MNTTYLTSPGEFGALGPHLPDAIAVGWVEERYGCDILVYLPNGKLGVQVKRVPDDFINSIADGRLARETQLMKKLEFPVLLLEGVMLYDADHRLLRNGRPTFLTETAVRNIQRSFRAETGGDTETTPNLVATAKRLGELVNYYSRRHLSLRKRPDPEGDWGIVDRRERSLWILQGFEGVGPTLAENIYDHFKCLPLRWACTREELERVRLIGKRRAESLWKFLEES